MTWTDLTVAGAYIAGIATGVLMTIRVNRYVVDYFAAQQERR